jgi:hypothetical protein
MQDRFAIARLRVAPDAERVRVNEPPPRGAISAADIGEYLASADDFAFEREVYSVANGLRFDTEHAGLYTDPITGKPRQYDIRASYKRGGNAIALAIECKSLKPDFPLVVSCVPRTVAEARHELLRADTVEGLHGSFTRITTVESANIDRAYPPGRGVGKSMRQVRRETKGQRDGQMVSGDDVFDKWTQALASIADLVAEGAELLSTGTRQPMRHIAFLPVLVVSDGTLWIADYSLRGDLQSEPFQYESVTYYLGRKYPLKREGLTFTITHLHITTRSAIRTVLAEIANGGGIWREMFGP